MPRRKLLVIDIDAASDSVLAERAEILARTQDMDAFIYCPIPDGNNSESPGARQAKCERRLHDCADALQRRSVAVETRTENVASLSEATLRCIDAVRPEMVLTSSGSANHAYAQEADQLVSDLLADTHCDVWVVQRAVGEGRRTIMAAISLDTKSAARRIRDKVLLRTADIARRLDADAHVVHAFRISRPTELVVDLLPERIPGPRAQDIETQHVNETHDALERFDFRKDFIHVVQGELTQELRRLVTSMEIDAIVAGASTKGRPSGRAENDYPTQLIDNLPCDVLIVRP
jgi:universal stress protein E